MNRFAGKAAVVTGASRGLGRVVAEALATEGASVACVGRQHDALTETAEAIGSNAIPVVADVRSGDEVANAIRAAVNAFGAVDLLVNCAGVLKTGAVPDFSEDDWRLLFDTNAKGVFLFCKHVIPQMRANGGGAIVNVSSVFGYAATEGSAVYAASKAAVNLFTQTLALEHVRDGIRINGVAPGTMPTPLVHEIAAAAADPAAVLKYIDGLHPLGRMIDPTEVAATVLFLLSDDASGIVGQTFVVDGGRLAKLGSAG